MKPTLVLAVVASLLQVGCLQTIDIGTGSDGGSPAGPITKADVLFVIDDSCSMAGEQATLSSRVSDLVDAFEAENATRKANGQPELDYRFAVTTTSVSQRAILPDRSVQLSTTYGASGTSCGSAYPIRVGDPYAAGEFMAVPGNDTILDSAKLSIPMLKAELAENVRIGTCGSGQEQGLLAMDLALQKQPDFPRKNDRLVVVILSDEEDCSDPNHQVAVGYTPDGDECVNEADKPDGGALGPVSGYAAPLVAASDDAHVVVIVSAIYQGNDLVSGVCDDSMCDASCTSGNPKGPPCYCGGTTGGSRYLELAKEVPGSTAESICYPGVSNGVDDLVKLVLAK